jgi:hypothetical protein
MAPGEGHMFQTAKRHYNQQEKKERVLEHKLRLGYYTATNTIHRRSADLFDLNTFMEHVTKFKLKKKKNKRNITIFNQRFSCKKGSRVNI